MLNRRTFLVSVLTPLAAGVLDRSVARAFAQKPSAIPPTSYSCPMHAEVVEDKPGACPICGMTLAPVRLALIWSCIVHTDVSKQAPGPCPRCGRDLVRVTKAMTFRCPVHR